MRISVGIATPGTVKVQTMGSVIAAMSSIEDQKMFSYQQSCYVHEARTNLALVALEYKCDYLIFVDSDMAFERDAFSLLLSNDKDIVGTNYNMRERTPPVSTVKLEDAGGNLIDGPVDWPTAPFKCRALGTGLMAVRVDVFNRIEKPWFHYIWEGTKLSMGEDIWFCQQARNAGIEIWCDPRVKVKHLGDFAY